MFNDITKQYFEMNTSGVRKDEDVFMNDKLKKSSPIVEVFSTMAQGNELNELTKKHGENVINNSSKRIKDLGLRANAGDGMAKAELNTIQRYIVDAKLLTQIQLFDFMGTFKDIPYDEQPKVKTYKHESIGSKLQANSGDTGLAITSWEEYPVKSQTISSGYAVNYREVASGNLDKVQEGMSQVQIDMMNKAVHYVVYTMYNSIKNATGVKYFGEANGFTKAAVDSVITKVRRFGRPAIMGDYSSIVQLTDFEGYDFVGSGSSKYKSEAVMNELRQMGYLSFYNGSSVVEIPNQYNLTKLNTAGDNFKTYMPEGLLFFIPQGNTAPLNIFRRGGITSATAMDIITASEITRFDMEIAADLAKGREFEIGLLSDTNFEAPNVNF